MAPPRTRLFAGTSGWAYPTWRPGFYPGTVPPRRFLEHYAGRLNSVEVNYTFRTLPTPAQVEEWLAAAPRPFRFSFKAPETITHRRRLRNCDAEIGAFLEAIAPARRSAQLGMVLFQVPPNFKPDLPLLEAFLSLPAMRNAGRVSFEFRHPGWFTQDYYAVLRRHGAALCVAETEDLLTPEVHTARRFTSYRMRRPGGYTAQEAEAHAARFAALAAGGREVYVHYMHEDEPHGPLAAEAMLRAAAAVVE